MRMVEVAVSTLCRMSHMLLLQCTLSEHAFAAQEMLSMLASLSLHKPPQLVNEGATSPDPYKLAHSVERLHTGPFSNGATSGAKPSTQTSKDKPVHEPT